MSSWRPPQAIRVKVLGLVSRGEDMLVVEVNRDDGQRAGVRSLGGSVQFGETREQALHREFAEELNTAIAITGPWRVFENLYVHEGQQGHEILFIADIELADRALYDRSEIIFSEDSGTTNRAVWISRADLKSGEVALFPPALLNEL